jgi:hypothetical protein
LDSQEKWIGWRGIPALVRNRDLNRASLSYVGANNRSLKLALADKLGGSRRTIPKDNRVADKVGAVNCEAEGFATRYNLSWCDRANLGVPTVCHQNSGTA